MQNLLRLVPIFLFVVGTPLTAEEPKLTEAQLAIQGTWRFDQCFIDGKLTKWDFEYTFIRDQVTVVAPKNPALEIITGKYKLDVTKQPAQLDFIFPLKQFGIVHHKGLYSINKDQLVFCFHSRYPSKRPEELVEKSQAGLNVIILERKPQ